MKKSPPIIITEDYWRNSQLSIARIYGGINYQNVDYRIVNERGIDVFALSDPKSVHYVGEDKDAIESGHPADLVQLFWIPIYRALGRGKFIKMLQNKPDITLAQAKKLVKNLKQNI